ncbi:hypothetical protein [Pseudoalteromonas rubra]|uniref:Uncharacterized protein n=1 Tax=Pseudoalteromonas rubra TaxID=43658 RepID=A0A0F4QNU2_9GAMM|nr:hypothetical protein [Pseudoalteromonas rubra]KJZ09378.1 hypothetical protein TW77_10135 [Pseudoalteromonas rubra]
MYINGYTAPSYAHKVGNPSMGATERTPGSQVQSGGSAPESDNRESYVKYINSATEEQLAGSIDAIKKYGPPVAMFRMSDIVNAANQDEIHGRIGRAIEHFEVEAQQYHTLELAIISEGEQAGKSSKEILQEIVALRDQQSALFKMGTQWGSKGLAHPDNDKQLVAATPGYVNLYA